VSSSKPKKIDTPPDPAPAPIQVETVSTKSPEGKEFAKKKARKKRGGREANILAGRLTAQHNDILKTQLG
jgi:hypothetical protein